MNCKKIFFNFSDHVQVFWKHKCFGNISQLETRTLIGWPSESTNQRPGFQLTYVSKTLTLPKHLHMIRPLVYSQQQPLWASCVRPQREVSTATTHSFSPPFPVISMNPHLGVVVVFVFQLHMTSEMNNDFLQSFLQGTLSHWSNLDEICMFLKG